MIGAISLLAAGAAAAQTTSHEVKITNSGKTPVVSLSTSPPGKSDWGADMLGVRTIKPGETLAVEVKGADCQLDFQAVMDDGAVVEKAGVDVCAPGAAVTL